jgi:hypothetical protein
MDRRRHDISWDDDTYLQNILMIVTFLLTIITIMILIL